MNEIEFITGLLDLAGQLLLSVVLLWLLINERRAHEETRNSYRADMLEIMREYQHTLKEIAGMRAALWRENNTKKREELNPGE